MDPIIGGSLISAAGSLASGIMGSRSARKQNKISQEWANYWNEQQMHNTIGARVADAKRSGIHPLYALGASPGFSANVVAGQHSSGSGIGDALQAIGSGVAAYGSAKEKRRAAELERIRQLEMDQVVKDSHKASAAADWALAQKRLSELKRSEQAAIASPGTVKTPVPDTSYTDPWGNPVASHKGTRAGEASELHGEFWPEVDMFLYGAQERFRNWARDAHDWYDRKTGRHNWIRR